MSGNMKQKNRLIDKLWRRQKGLCHWCKCQMLKPNGTFSGEGNYCTRDHLDSRLSANRGQFSGLIRSVAACYKCNQRRSMEEVRALPIEEQRRRSAQGRGEQSGGWKLD